MKHLILIFSIALEAYSTNLHLLGGDRQSIDWFYSLGAQYGAHTLQPLNPELPTLEGAQYELDLSLLHRVRGEFFFLLNQGAVVDAVQNFPNTTSLKDTELGFFWSTRFSPLLQPGFKISLHIPTSSHTNGWIPTQLENFHPKNPTSYRPHHAASPFVEIGISALFHFPHSSYFFPVDFAFLFTSTRGKEIPNAYGMEALLQWNQLLLPFHLHYQLKLREVFNEKANGQINRLSIHNFFPLNNQFQLRSTLSLGLTTSRDNLLLGQDPYQISVQESFGAGLFLHWNFGNYALDSDRDKIPNQWDHCPLAAEDFDQYLDEDGCPDPDNDGDRLMDTQDLCPMNAEDLDGFEDHDGCPDLDNDQDRILDRVDQCPNQPEDYDAFLDTDGCPDLDNDGDKINDTEDLCPLLAEDLDQIQDLDGCPETDADLDGIPDPQDRCPETPGTFQKNTKRHGCPLIPTTTRQLVAKSLFFPTDQHQILPHNKSLLQTLVANHASPQTHWIIQGHADQRGTTNYNDTLSQKRVLAVQKALLAYGVAPHRITLEFSGEKELLSSGTSPEDHLLNRRVDIQVFSHRDEQ